MAVLRPVVPDVPVREDADGGEAHVQPNHHVAEEDPRRDELVVGTAGRVGGQMEMVHPEYRLGESAQLLEAALTPVYPTVSGLGQSTWRKLCGQALALLSKNPPGDLLDGITDDHVSLTEAITFLHNPPPTAELSQIQQGTHPAQIRLAREELIAHQLTVQGVRDSEQRHPAPAIAPASSAAAAFLKALPFAPTSAQQRVAIELAEDMAQTQPMLRLVQGDVGSGKTLVAARAALDTIAAGYQVAFMAPTELLAEQHYATLDAWLTPLDQSVAWLSGRTKGQARQHVLQQLASGEAPLVVTVVVHGARAPRAPSAPSWRRASPRRCNAPSTAAASRRGRPPDEKPQLRHASQIGAVAQLARRLHLHVCALAGFLV